jgi:cell division protein FtsI/penicillin-binding protein 2
LVGFAEAAIQPGTQQVEPKKEEIRKSAILKPGTVKDVTEALVGVTEGEKGTGQKARLEGYRVAGKTGTAQTVDSKTKRYSIQPQYQEIKYERS